MIENADITAYLNRHYRIRLGRFVDNETNNAEWGLRLATKLSIIYSLTSEVCESALKYWAVNAGMSEEAFDTAWDRPRLDGALAHEPKRTNRFVLNFPPHFAIESWCISSATRPSMYFETNKIFGITYSKKIKWDPIQVTLIDPIGPSVTQSLMTILKNFINEEFTMKLEMLDPVGTAVEKWKITNCKITAMDFGSLSYQEDDIAKCIMTINIGDAVLEY